MTKYVVRSRSGGRGEDISAWCEGGCSWQVSGGRDPYGPSKAARRHTERTGHTTTADRVARSVWFDALREVQS